MKTLVRTLIPIALLAHGAHAEPTESVTVAAPPPEPTAAVTVSFLHLIVPMAEVTTEVRVGQKLGVAVIAGAGMIRDDATNDRITLLEGGVSARYYLTGSFRSGLQIGAEAAYVHASTTDMSIDIRARGLGLSPFVGYKWTHSSGFTLDGQIGATFMTARAESTLASANNSKIGPMLNLNVGWSL